jgi:hypothetical protein
MLAVRKSVPGHQEIYGKSRLGTKQAVFSIEAPGRDAGWAGY